MYAYKYDEETGGLLLMESASTISKEPRPVYSRELDILGFDKIWQYEQHDDIPYLWAEANYYWYRGARVAKTIGGSLYERPSIEFERDENGELRLPIGALLRPVDIPRMIEKNRWILDTLETLTVKKIFDVYNRYKNKLDCFHVAFSGGKDSIVLLELVKRALPNNAFIVIFGDTGMEFPDTYNVIDAVEAQCKTDGIAFYRASSHLKPEESWRLFGPPSRVLRWCCSVHKSVPQTLKIREILGKDNYTGMDFVGVRAQESATRADYDYENYGKKQKGQYSHNPILEWSSAEVWLYIYSHHLIINSTYLNGNSRAGCLFCPRGGGKADYFRNISYHKEIEQFTNLIKETISDPHIDTYITNGGWIERKNGRDLKRKECEYTEEIINDTIRITIGNPKSDWRVWIQTLGDIAIPYSVHNISNGYIVEFPISAMRSPEIKLLKQIFHKASACHSCRACEANCTQGAIRFDGGLHIENCIHCGQCHAIDDGCISFHSIQQPKNGGHVMKSLNTFADHAPKSAWVIDFFKKGSSFLKDNSLGPMQISMFKRFLSDAGLIQKNATTELFNTIVKIGVDSESAWAILLINLVHTNPQFLWYIKNLDIGQIYQTEDVVSRLNALSVSEKDARSILKSFKRFCEIPLGTKLKFGSFLENGRKLKAIERTKTSLSDPRVVLYGLYKFAEACDRYYEFTLTRLMDFSIESAGVSPAEIFGFNHDEMEQYLHGLAQANPEFISFTTTHDLEVLRLVDDRTSADVLELF